MKEADYFWRVLQDKLTPAERVRIKFPSAYCERIRWPETSCSSRWKIYTAENGKVPLGETTRTKKEAWLSAAKQARLI